MAEIFVEQRGPQQYVALRCEAIVATGTTQEDTALRAHRLYPGDVVFGKRVRTTTIESRDKWSVIHHLS
jgi:hypothetical protein